MPGDTTVGSGSLTAEKGKPLSLMVSGDDLQSLGEIAKRNGVSINALVREILSGWLKYR